MHWRCPKVELLLLLLYARADVGQIRDDFTKAQGCVAAPSFRKDTFCLRWK